MDGVGERACDGGGSVTKCVCVCCFVFFFNDTPPTEIYPLSLRDALPISSQHFREVSHEPPGTEGGEKCMGEEGGGGAGVCRWRGLHVCACWVCVGCGAGSESGRRLGCVGLHAGAVDVMLWVTLAWRHGHPRFPLSLSFFPSLCGEIGLRTAGVAN